MNTQGNSPFIIFITGASGAGKTTLLRALSLALPSSSCVCLHFDSIGVPSEKAMIEQYGSPSAWQKAMTERWVAKLTNDYPDRQLVILEGQVNLTFIVAAFQKVNFTHYKIILADCDTAVRHQRLQQHRQQPELVNETMDNWSRFLKTQAVDMQATILDTSHFSVDEMIDWFKHYLFEMDIDVRQNFTPSKP